MEFEEVVRTRAMTRSFSSEPLDESLLSSMLSDALRSPTAGNTRGTAFVALRAPSQLDAYWNAATDETWRQQSRRYPRMRRAPVVVLAVSRPSAYAERYGLDDKIAGGLDALEAWPLPYWHTDAAFATMALLLGATNQGLGACFLGAFRNVASICDAASIPSDWALFGSVLLGHRGPDDHRSVSLDRSVITRESRIFFDHFGERKD